MSENNGEKMRNGRSSRHASSQSDDSSEDGDKRKEHNMRVGQEYQAQIPECSSGSVYDEKPEALLVWAPSPDLSDAKVDEYLRTARDLHDYNMEQALGMLFWHKYNIQLALNDLSNFVPFLDDWSIEDKVLFEQAFDFHGKNFHLIRRMLPDKSIAALVKYFYSWKGTRSKCSVIDKQAKKLSNGAASREGSDSDSSSDEESKDKDDKEENRCVNCDIVTSELHVTRRGSLCHSCYLYWRKRGKMKSVRHKTQGCQQTGCCRSVRHKLKPPRGIHLDMNELLAIISDPANQPQFMLKSVDSEIVCLKQTVQNNKQILSAQKQQISSGIDEFRPPQAVSRISSCWTNEDLLLAVQGVRKYGQDFKAIAEVIGNKTEAHLSSFFVNFRRRYNLDEVIKEYETEMNKFKKAGAKHIDESCGVEDVNVKMEMAGLGNGRAKTQINSMTPLGSTRVLKPVSNAVSKSLRPAKTDSSSLLHSSSTKAELITDWKLRQ